MPDAFAMAAEQGCSLLSWRELPVAFSDTCPPCDRTVNMDLSAGSTLKVRPKSRGTVLTSAEGQFWPEPSGQKLCGDRGTD